MKGLCVSGTDVNYDSVGSFFVDWVFEVPPSNSDQYVEALVDILNHEEIDYYIPTHSAEIRVVSENESTIRNAAPAASFIVSPFETFLALDDKLLLTQNLSSKGIPTPRQLDVQELEDAALPIFVKRRYGSGAKGSMIIKDPSMMHCMLKRTDVIGFEYIEGPELTIDCMFDDDGRLLSYNQRRRIKTLGGAAVVTANDFDFDLHPYLNAFEENWTFKGCVNFQCIIRKGIPFFTDINLRYPSGGLPLTVESGVDIPDMVIRVLSGEKIAVGEYASDRKVRTMYRYFDEKFSVSQ